MHRKNIFPKINSKNYKFSVFFLPDILYRHCRNQIWKFLYLFRSPPMGAAGAQKRRVRVKTKTKETWDTTTWRRLGYQDQLKGEYFLQYLTFSSAILPFACKHSLLDLCANLSWEGIVAGHLKSHTYLLNKSDV